jgi:hypothetical protein
MSEDELDPIDRAFAEGTPIDRALEAAVRQALQQHKRAGNPVVEWREGEIRWVPPDKIDVTEET